MHIFIFFVYYSNRPIRRDKMVEWFENGRPGDRYATSGLHDTIKKMLEFIQICLLTDNNRPNCQQFLDAMNNWSVTDDEVRKEPEFSTQMKYLDLFDKFFVNFIRYKLGIDN